MAAMPTFRTLSQVGKIKPGAVVLAEVRDPAGNVAPALVAQQFGKGHVGALLIGDLWRWGLRRENPAESDLEQILAADGALAGRRRSQPRGSLGALPRPTRRRPPSS